MGGAKKPTAASKDKASSSRDTKKKKDKGEGGGPKKAEITVQVNSKQAMRIIENSKVITVQDLARQIGVKISAANAFLRESVDNGIIKRVGGYSGHYLYQMETKEEEEEEEEKDISLESKSDPQPNEKDISLESKSDPQPNEKDISLESKSDPQPTEGEEEVAAPATAAESS